MMSSIYKTIIIAVIGAVIGAAILFFVQQLDSSGVVPGIESSENKPLYWVAPMDANYRRDKPGKSPMGMDLVPVYQEDVASNNQGAGVVNISPQVINNLGVRTAPVELKNMQMEISTVGYVQYDEDKLIHIHPRVDGWIEKLFVKAAGNPVAKGQPLYTLYSPQLVNAQEELLIALKRNNRPLIQAAKDRLKALQLSDSFISKLANSGQVQQNITFYSPQAGVVAGLKIREGFYVKPGNTLLSIGQLDQVWVEAEVFERDAALIYQGLPVSMSLDYLPGKSWQGRVDYVYPTLNSKTRTLRVRLKFDNADHQLKPNMFAQVSIHASQEEEVILVPKESVIRTGKQDRVVLALGDGQFKSIAVTVGRVNHQSVEILSGLTSDDTVVTSAQFLIDSESSKSSDFNRMSQNEVPKSVWVAGEVIQVIAEQGLVNISHDAVEKWNWPPMQMDFNVSDDVDIRAIQAGQSLHFEISKLDDDSYEISAIHIMEQSHSEQEVSSATVDGIINTVDIEKRVLNISREAIDKWNRPAATMDFTVVDSIDLAQLKTGDEIRFTFEIRDDFTVVELTIKQPGSSKVNNDHNDHSGH